VNNQSNFRAKQTQFFKKLILKFKKTLTYHGPVAFLLRHAMLQPGVRLSVRHTYCIEVAERIIAKYLHCRYAIQGHSRSPAVVPIESPYTTSY